MNRKKFTVSKMICTNCGREGIPIPRKTSKARERGHLKELYCYNCKAMHNHREFRSEWDEIVVRETLEEVR